MSSGGPRGKSTRLAIVEQSLADTVERLRELTPGPRVRELRAKAEGYDRALRAWLMRAAICGSRVSGMESLCRADGPDVARDTAVRRTT